jgi:hypothetical protein
MTIYSVLQELITVPDFDDMVRGIDTPCFQASYMPEIRHQLTEVGTVLIPAGPPNVLELVIQENRSVKIFQSQHIGTKAAPE